MNAIQYSLSIFTEQTPLNLHWWTILKIYGFLLRISCSGKLGKVSRIRGASEARPAHSTVSLVARELFLESFLDWFLDSLLSSFLELFLTQPIGALSIHQTRTSIITNSSNGEGKTKLKNKLQGTECFKVGNSLVELLVELLVWAVGRTVSRTQTVELFVCSADSAHTNLPSSLVRIVWQTESLITG